MTKPEQITDAVAEHGEGPVWYPAWNGLCFVDMMVGDILRLDPTGSVDRWHVGVVAAVFRPRRDGGIVVAAEREFLLGDELGGALAGLGSVFDDPALRFNDGGCDPEGNFYVGNMGYDDGPPGRGTVYRLATDHTVTEAFSGTTVSNGLAWTADGTTAYYNDTKTQRIDAFSWDAERGLHDRRPFVEIDPDDGGPDGLTVDADGGVWTALFGGSTVRHYDAGGRLDDVIELPVPKVTACTLGGDRLDRLFITTSREDEDVSTYPSAGAVFVADVGTPGLAVLPYAG